MIPRPTLSLPRVRLRRVAGARLRLPVWALLAMAVAMLLRVVSGLPVVQTPHAHGGIQHTHGAGGLAHDHDHDHDHDHAAADAGAIPHRHGDGPLHIDLPDGKTLIQTESAHPPRRLVKTNDYPVFIPVRWPPDHLAKKKPEPAPLPEAPHDHRDTHRDDYFCAAATAALSTGAFEVPWPLEAVHVASADYTAPLLGLTPTPRQTRGPPLSA